MALARLKGAESDAPRRKKLQPIIVTTRFEQIPPAANEFLIISRPDELSDGAEDFLSSIAKSLRAIGDQFGIRRVEEPKRLFEAKEYRAAVISAMSLLEGKLREQLKTRQWSDIRRPMSMHSLVGSAVENQLIPGAVRPKIDSWMRARNGVVHSQMTVTKSQAREIVDGVLDLVKGFS